MMWPLIVTTPVRLSAWADHAICEGDELAMSAPGFGIASEVLPAGPFEFTVSFEYADGHRATHVTIYAFSDEDGNGICNDSEPSGFVTIGSGDQEDLTIDLQVQACPLFG